VGAAVVVVVVGAAVVVVVVGAVVADVVVVDALVELEGATFTAVP